MIKQIQNTKLYVGPVSKNVIESVVEFVNETGFSIGFTATTNQISNNCYTGISVKQLKKMINKNILCRDHFKQKNGEESFDIIHIDPWLNGNFYNSVDVTNNWLSNSKYFYEIGTEEAVYSYDEYELDKFLSIVYKEDSKAVYAVVQSGSKLRNGMNIGKYDESKLAKTINVCKKHGIMSKEHNGDYMSDELIKRKFEFGLNAINIAPEFGSIESCTIWDNLDEKDQNYFYKLCIKSSAWKKWVTYDFDLHDRRKLVKICGHYIFNLPGFKKIEFDNNVIKKAIKQRLIQLRKVIMETL